MKFDYIIQNPPYLKTLHIDCFNKGLDILKEDGKMTIIEPATWLIDVRQKIVDKPSLSMQKYIDLKQKLGKHIYKVVIENYNKEFDTAMYVPFSVTYIDMKHEYDTIDFWCCGEHKTVNYIYDCNMIGSYDMIWSILNKIKAYGDTMKNHIYKPGKTKTDENTKYISFCDIIARSGVSDPRFGDIWFINNYYTNYYYCYINFNEKISNKPINSLKSGYTYNKPKYTDKIADNLYGTKQELENWKHFIFNNKIPLFTSIVLIISQNNRCKDFIPWLTDKQYSDDEIYKLLNITKEEQEFIDKTLKKYERNSPWFKRYLCGKDSVSNEEVQKFIDSL